MPVTTNLTVIKEEVLTVDTFTVRAFRVVMPDDNTKAFMEVYVDAGISTAEGITWLDQKVHVLEGEAFATVLALTTSGGTLYDEIKVKLYEICTTNGWIPG